MEHAFWHARWAEGRIGFHQDEFNSQLQAYWSGLGVSSDGQVLVPLCGKSGDMLWLRERGYSVVGVELNQSACEAFFAERDAEPMVRQDGSYLYYGCDGVELLCGDVFSLSAAQLKDVGAVYDRAALVALPPEMRKQYAQMLIERLPVGVSVLLITMEFEGEQGPPFSVLEPEVEALFSSRFKIERLSERSESAGRQDVAYRLMDKC